MATLGEDGAGSETGDGDGDGDGDPCAGGSKPGTVCLWTRDLIAAGGIPTGIDAAQLGLDTKMTVAAAMFTGGGIQTWSVSLEGTLDPSSSPQFGDGFRDAAFADINGDGWLDLLGAHPQLNLITLFLGTSDGTFGPWQVLTVSRGPRALVPVDLTGDGREEVVVVRESGGFSVLTYGAEGLASLQTWDAAGSFYDAASGDLDQDGNTDIALIDEAGDQIRLFYGAGDGTLQQGGAVAVGDAPRGVALGDLTGDGRMDMVVTTFGDDRMTSFVAQAGQRAGTFEEVSSLPLGLGPYGVRLADMDLDGVLDAITPISGLGAVAVVLSDGHGGLIDRIPFFTGASPIDVIVRDFDEDGIPDLVVSNAGAQSLLLMGSQPPS